MFASTQKRTRFALICAGLIAALTFGLFGAAIPAQAQGGTTPVPVSDEIAKALIAAVVKATGMSEAELLQAFLSGKSAVQILKEKGKDVEAVRKEVTDAVTKIIDDAVTAGKLTSEQGTRLKNTLNAAVTRVLNGGRLSTAMGSLMPALPLDIVRTALNVVAEATKMTRVEITRALVGGKTFEAILKEKNADVAAITAQIKTKVSEAIKTAVTNKRITQAQADEILAGLDKQIADILTKPVSQALLPGRNNNQRGPQNRAEALINAQAVATLVNQTVKQTGLRPREVTAKLRQGKTLAEIAAEAKTRPAQIIEEAQKILTERINRLVEQNRITKEVGKTLIDNLPNFLKNLMDKKNPLQSAAPGRNRR